MIELNHQFTNANQHLNLKWIKEDNWHVTVLFIGSFPEEHLANFIEHIGQWNNIHCFEIMFEEFTFFPGQHPRMIWAKFFQNDSYSNIVRQLHHKTFKYIEKNLLNIKLNHKEEQIPHITLCRFKDKCLVNGPLKTAHHDGLIMPVNHIHLMKSELLSEGAKYTLLHDFSLHDGKN